MISTPTDLNRFWHALLNGRLLPREIMAKMRSTVPLPQQWQEFLGADAGYGLGVMRIPLSCGGFAWGHGGDLAGVSNVSAGKVHGAAATVYRTAQVTAQQPQLRTLETAEIALCTSRHREHEQAQARVPRDSAIWSAGM